MFVPLSCCIFSARRYLVGGRLQILVEGIRYKNRLTCIVIYRTHLEQQP